MFSMPLIQEHLNTDNIFTRQLKNRSQKLPKKKYGRGLNVSTLPLFFLLNKKNDVAGKISDLQLT